MINIWIYNLLGDASSGSAVSADEGNAEYEESSEDNYEEDTGAAAAAVGAENWESASDSAGSSSGGSVGSGKSASKSASKDSPKKSADPSAVVVNADGMLMPASGPSSTSQPTADPYFTHFDPHYEHQSYKVSEKVSVILLNFIFIHKWTIF